jgi:hypothetical protein
MSKDNGANPALEVSKEILKGNNEPIVLLSGIRINILPVSATLLDEMSSRIVDPEPPVVYIEAKDRHEPNPNDPDYLKELAANDRRRNTAAFDIMAMFGIDIVDGMPEDKNWLKKLQMLERLGHLDLSHYDLDDEFDLEFIYKRYIILTADLLGKIGRASGLTEEEVSRAEETFQSN